MKGTKIGSGGQPLNLHAGRQQVPYQKVQWLAQNIVHRTMYVLNPAELGSVYQAHIGGIR
jgi:hypothetical protein